MPPKKSTSPTARSNSRKRLSSQTEETPKTLNEEAETDQELDQAENLNSDGQTTSSSSSEEELDTDVDSEDEEEKEVEKATDPKPSRKSPKKAEETPDEYRRVGGEPEGHIIRLGDDLNFPATKHDSFAVVDKDVYREVGLRGTKRVSYQLVYRAGTAIPLSKLNELK